MSHMKRTPSQSSSSLPSTAGMASKKLRSASNNADLLQQNTAPLRSSQSQLKQSQASHQGPSSNQIDKPITSIIKNDTATKNLNNLRQVKFLADTNSDEQQLEKQRTTSLGRGGPNTTGSAKQVSSTLDARAVEEKTGHLAREYLMKKQNLSANIQSVINRSRVKQQEIYQYNLQKQQDERNRKAARKAGASEFTKSLMQDEDDEEEVSEPDENDQSAEVYRTEKEQAANPKLANGFVLSKRNAEMRARDSVGNQVSTAEQEKEALIQRLNDALVQLDTLNETKRSLSDKLAEQINFVRDLAVANGDSGTDDLNTLVNESSKYELKKEKELNQQLQQQVSKAESEKNELLSRLQHISGTTGMNSDTQDGSKMTYQACSNHIIHTVNAIRDCKINIEHCQNELAVCQENIAMLEHENVALHHNYDHLNCQKNQLIEEVNLINQKEEEAVIALQHERERADKVHKIHIKLLAVRLLEENFQRVLKRQYTAHFREIQRLSDSTKSQFTCVWAMRKVFKMRERLQAKKCLAIWNQRCVPLKMRLANEKLPTFFAKREFKRYFFAKWMQRYKEHQTENVSIQASLIRMFKNLQEMYHSRMMYYWRKWRKRLVYKFDAIKHIRFMMLTVCHRRQALGFRKWQEVMAYQNFNARLQFLRTMAVQRAATAKMFYVMRDETSKMKLKRWSLTLRSFKNLKVHMRRLKYDKNFDILMAYQRKYVETLLQQSVINALRFQVAKSKYEKIYAMLKGEVDPQMLLWEQDILRAQKVQIMTFKRRALTAILNNSQSRILGVKFQHWKRHAMTVSYRLKKIYKPTIWNAYKRMVQDALDRWRLKLQLKAIDRIKNENKKITKHSKELENSIHATTREIQLSEQQFKGLASKRVKKLIVNAYNSNLRHYLMMWRNGSYRQRVQEQGAQVVQAKLRKRMLRVMLKKYQKGSWYSTVDISNAKRVDEVTVRLKVRAQRRIFKAIQVYALQSARAKSFFKRIYKATNQTLRQQAFNRWKAKHNIGKTENYFKIEQDLVAQIQEKQIELGNHQNILNSKQTENKKQKEALKNHSARVMISAVFRYHEGGLKYGFKTWKEKTGDFIHRDRIMRTLTMILANKKQAAAMQNWKFATKCVVNEEKLKEVHFEMITNQSKLVDMNQISVQNRKKADSLMVSASQQSINNDEIQRKLENVLNAIMTRRENFSAEKKTKLILEQWLYQNKRRKQLCNSIELAVQKIQKKIGFKALRDLYNEEIVLDREDRIKRHFMIQYRRIKLRRMFCVWKGQCLAEIKFNQFMVKEEMEEAEAQHVARSLKIRNWSFKCQQERIERNMKLAIWNNWRKNIFKSSVTVVHHTDYRDRFFAYQVRRSLYKWKTRTELTQQHRKLAILVKQRQNRILMQLAFKSFKRSFSASKFFTRKIINLLSGQIVCRKNEAFQAILARKQMNKSYKARQYIHKIEKLHYLIDIKLKNHQGWAVQNLRMFNQQIQSAMPIRFWLEKLVRGRQLRTAFTRWSRQADYESTALKFNHEDGPRNMECFKLQQEVRTLTEMLKQDGKEGGVIQQELVELSDKSKSIIRKCILRWRMYKDGNQWLKPYVFDYLKFYTRRRRLYRKRLMSINDKIERKDKGAAMKRALKIWYLQIDDKKRYFYGMQYGQLTNHALMQARHLNNRADDIDGLTDSIAGLTDQRDALLTGFIGAQKLVCSYAIHSQQKAQAQVFSKLSDNSSAKLNLKISSALELNLQKIHELKNIIASHEQNNQELAESSDAYRQQAMDAIDEARHMEALQREKEKLTQEMTDSADRVKILLEQNYALSRGLHEVNGLVQSQRMQVQAMGQGQSQNTAGNQRKTIDDLALQYKLQSQFQQKSQPSDPRLPQQNPQSIQIYNAQQPISPMMSMQEQQMQQMQEQQNYQQAQQQRIGDAENNQRLQNTSVQSSQQLGQQQQNQHSAQRPVRDTREPQQTNNSQMRLTSPNYNSSTQIQQTRAGGGPQHHHPSIMTATPSGFQSVTSVAPTIYEQRGVVQSRETSPLRSRSPSQRVGAGDRTLWRA